MQTNPTERDFGNREKTNRVSNTLFVYLIK